MARYVSYTNTGSQALPVSEEHCIYGSSRLGMDQRRETLLLAGAYNPGTSSARRELGNKHYELSNHLGNVLLSVTDKKAYKTLSGSLYFEAEITSISDYYPFGSAMQTRAYSAVGYRWGFNGKEKESDGTAATFNFGSRVYESRIAKWFSIDPYFKNYVAISPLGYVSGNPLIAVDFDGNEIIIVGSPAFQEKVKAQIQSLTNDKVILKNGVIYLAQSGMGSQNKDKNLAFGTGIVRQLNSKEEGHYTVTIVETPNTWETTGPTGKTIPNGPAYLKDDGTPGVGEGSLIKYDAFSSRAVKHEGLEEKQFSPQNIVLGHELIHAMHRWNGVKSDILTDKINPDNPTVVYRGFTESNGNPKILDNYLKSEEYTTRLKENVLRTEQGVQLRAIPKKKDGNE